jgi:hypothetical protein
MRVVTNPEVDSNDELFTTPYPMHAAYSRRTPAPFSSIQNAGLPRRERKMPACFLAYEETGYASAIAGKAAAPVTRLIGPSVDCGWSGLQQGPSLLLADYSRIITGRKQRGGSGLRRGHCLAFSPDKSRCPMFETGNDRVN